MKVTRQQPAQTRRDAWISIDLGALEQNTRHIRSRVPKQKKLMAILKADAYGHGAVMALPTLEASGVEMVGVASVDEALQIREAGLEIPILVIGIVPDWSIQTAAQKDIQLTVFSEHHLASIEQAYRQNRQKVSVQVKVDTGMQRIGVDWQAAPDFICHCQQLPYLSVTGVFSHLACTSDPAITRLQQDRWHQVVDQLDPLPEYQHLSNSAGALHYPDTRETMVRVGYALYGYEPDSATESLTALQPVMGLKARIIRIQDIPAGAGVSYGYTWHSDKPARIATLPLGYADGIPRVLSNQIRGLLKGQSVPQVGTITMDQLMIDITDVSDAQVGEAVTLIGSETDSTGKAQQITLTDWAKAAGTIEYELMCGLRVRLPKTYIR